MNRSQRCRDAYCHHLAQNMSLYTTCFVSVLMSHHPMRLDRVFLACGKKKKVFVIRMCEKNQSESLFVWVHTLKLVMNVSGSSVWNTMDEDSMLHWYRFTLLSKIWYFLAGECMISVSDGVKIDDIGTQHCAGCLFETGSSRLKAVCCTWGFNKIHHAFVPKPPTLLLTFQWWLIDIPLNLTQHILLLYC